MSALNLLVYTRAAVEGSYNRSVGNSIHFAWAQEGSPFIALNANYGILFPSADISTDNTINEKGAVKPYIFTLPEGGFGIVAIRVDKNGDADSGTIIYWKTKDLIHFTEQVVSLGETVIQELTARITDNGARLQVDWLGNDGAYVSSTIDQERGKVVESEPCDPIIKDAPSVNIEGAIPGNAIRVDTEGTQAFLRAWSPVESVDVNVPDSVVARSTEELRNVKATVVYSDGSTHRKAVQWDSKSVDFNTPGDYRVDGIVRQDVYPFPLAVGYADPVIFPWRGKYYFIATNDAKNQIGLYVREADSVAALFEQGTAESIILDYDEERGYIQTFWAPEFHVIGEELYILFAVGDKQWGPQSHLMKLKRGGAIMNAADWEEPIRVVTQDGAYLTTNGITLDMTHFNTGSSDYLIWSYRLMKPRDSGSMLYIATINPRQPWKLTSKPILLSRPLYGWENNNGTINNEGPYPLLVDDMVYLAFSGGAAGGYTYVLGYLIANIHTDLLNPRNWRKTCAPVLSSGSIVNEYGPGHNSFFVDRNGDIMNAYHAQERIEDNAPRCTTIRRVHFDAQGFPLLNVSTSRDLSDDLKKVCINVTVR